VESPYHRSPRSIRPCARLVCVCCRPVRAAIRHVTESDPRRNGQTIWEMLTIGCINQFVIHDTERRHTLICLAIPIKRRSKASAACG
jgi:hypothetical protein